MKIGVPVIISPTILYDLLRDRDFFRQVPAFFFMREPARAILDQLTEHLLHPQQRCPACGNLTTAMAPLLAMFASHVRAMHAEDPALLRPLADFIARRRGCDRVPVIVYNRENGLLKKIEF